MRKMERTRKPASFFLFPVLFFLFIIFFLRANSCYMTSLIDQTCKKSSQTDPNFSYGFCKTSLQAAPGSRCADLRGLGLAAVRLFRDNATDTRCLIRQLLGKKGLAPSVKVRLEDCLELYVDGVEVLTQAIKAYRAGNYFDANTFVSAAMTSSTTCEEGFHEKKGLVSPLKKQNQDAFDLGAISLSIINMQKWSTGSFMAG